MDPAYHVSGDQASYFGLGAMPEGPRDGEPGPSPSARGYWGTLLASLVASYFGLGARPEWPRGGKTRGLIYKISYDLSYDYLESIVRSTYDSDLQHAKPSAKNIVS